MKYELKSIPMFRNIALAFTGVVIGLVYVELLLRLAGFFYLSLREMNDRVAPADDGTFRILCVGESTTQGQYPAYLEEILAKKRPDVKFKVIDRGIAGTNTVEILDGLEGNIKKYGPQMIVAMMGINDSGWDVVWKKKFYEDLRLYKLVKIFLPAQSVKILGYEYYKPRNPGARMFDNVEAKTSRDKMIKHFSNTAFYTMGDKADIMLKALINTYPQSVYPRLRLVEFYLQEHRDDESKNAVKEMLAVFKTDPDIYKHIIYILLNKKDNAPAEKLLKECGQRMPSVRGAPWYLYEEGRILQVEGDIDGALKKYEASAQACNNASIEVLSQIGEIYFTKKMYPDAEKPLLKAYELSENSVYQAGLLGILYLDMGKKDKADYYFDKARLSGISICRLITRNNYVRLAQTASLNKIKLVCVQYPMRDAAPLKRMLENESGLFFVDNRGIFEKAVEENGYDRYFVDKFGGNFGHCTPEGNRMLAENIAKTILEHI